jgi:2-hydroxychromene-2-carboxylate isomerase
MTEKFNEQGGVSTMDPSILRRWISSKLMTSMSSQASLNKKRKQLERKRRRAGELHVVEYFHQVDDGYSHLAAQVLYDLSQRYDIQLRCHIVTGAYDNNMPEPELLTALSAYDAGKIASHYSLNFPRQAKEPDQNYINLALSIMAKLDNQSRIESMQLIGAALWSHDYQKLKILAKKLGVASVSEVLTVTANGNARRKALKHYSGGMFYYAKEWYWGIDRLYHLEQRLADLGIDRKANTPMIAPRQNIILGQAQDNGSLTLEIFASLRSPYTAIVFDRAVALAAGTGVTLDVKPILPMVMRGVPATSEKGMYIFTDAAREAWAADVPYGQFYDPIGEPVRRCYSLYPWAHKQGKGTQLLSSFLNAAFAQGINTNTDIGLKTVVENAGLDWETAKRSLANDDWKELLEQNRMLMYQHGLWGVPSFRLLNAQKEVVLAIWGQDRLWLIAREIQRILNS